MFIVLILTCAQAAVLEHFESGDCKSSGGGGGGNRGESGGGGGSGGGGNDVSKTVEGRHMAGVTMNGTSPGMDLKGWAEKHNNVKVFQTREGNKWRLGE
jgi:hypothetical protein